MGSYINDSVNGVPGCSLVLGGACPLLCVFERNNVKKTKNTKTNRKTYELGMQG